MLILLYCFLYIYIYVFFTRNTVVYNELRKYNSKSYIKKNKPGLFYKHYNKQISKPVLFYNYFSIAYILLFIIIGTILFFLDSEASHYFYLIVGDGVLLVHCIIYTIYNLCNRHWKNEVQNQIRRIFHILTEQAIIP